jgi:hypothetical protein
MNRLVPYSTLIASLVLFNSTATRAQVNVLTYHNNNSRTGDNLSETNLTLANVNSTTFGKHFTYTVDGYVYAQPLYVSSLNVPGRGLHNVLFIATQHNSVYAFDADSNGTNGGLIWQTNLGPSAVTPTADFGSRYGSPPQYTDILPEVGITGTPVIDLASGTMYLDSFTHQGASYFHRIHALSITNGAERPFGPVLVAASVPGTGVSSTAGVVSFVHKQQIQRSGLVLTGGKLFVAYSGYADTDPYHGWVLGYDASNLQRLTNFTFCTTPNSTVAQYGANAGEAGIWMGGGAIAVDANTNLYFLVGNGTFTATNGAGGTEYGDSFMRLSTTNGLAVVDYFTPYNQATLALNDTDLGSGASILLPDQPGPNPHLLVGAGKGGTIYLVNRDQMTTNNTHYNATSSFDPIVQTVAGQLGSGVFDTPAYFGGRIYYASNGRQLKSFTLSNGLLSTTPTSTSTRSYPFPGTTPIISANGANNGIVWALLYTNPPTPPSPGMLVAYNAANLTTELYNSTQIAGGRDTLPNSVKFASPIVANGKVYVGSQYAVSVFGLLSGTLAFSSPTYNVQDSGGSASITVTRIGGTQGAVQISYATVPGGTAVAGVDYVSTTGTLSWASGDASPKSFPIPIIDNITGNSNKTINLALSAPSGGAYLNLQSTAVLTILEDPYEIWAFAHFGTNANNPSIAGPLADPDHDGIDNILEYATASDPNVAAPGGTVLGVINAGNFQLTFHRNVSATDLTFAVKYSDTLTNWNDLMTYNAASGWTTNAPGAFVAESSAQGVPPDSYVTVTITDTSVLADPNAPTRFYRLAVHR